MQIPAACLPANRHLVAQHPLDGRSSPHRSACNIDQQKHKQKVDISRSSRRDSKFLLPGMNISNPRSNFRSLMILICIYFNRYAYRPTVFATRLTCKSQNQPVYFQTYLVQENRFYNKIYDENKATQELGLLTFQHRNLVFKFQHTPYVKCE